MCGIAGHFESKGPTDLKLVERMTEKIRHRGPDGYGLEQTGQIAFGHRRLAIIDLTENGKQPMFDHSGKYCITFNGEIYNYLELKNELESQGSRFKTHSDTEIILEAYKAWGDSCLKRFNGMFAFALWDSVQSRMLLARDRAGKKPLYYTRTPSGGVIFASELKCLLVADFVKRELNPKALSDYFRLNYILGNHSILKNIEKLQPGHSIVYSKNSEPQQTSYWDLAHHFKNKIDIDYFEAKDELLKIFDSSVELRMISDVPLGAFLSGGVDSSAIAASMQKKNKVRTFTIDFKEKSFSEAAEAQQVSRHIGTTHQEKTVDAKLATHLKDIVYFADEPFADTSMIPTYFLCQFTRQFVTVALSGDGGDELFAGYETYFANKIHQTIKSIPEFLVNPVRALANMIPASQGKVSLDYKIKKFLAGHSLSSQQAHYSWRTIFSVEELESLLQDKFKEEILGHDSFDEFERHFSPVESCDFLDQALYVDIKTWMVDDILVKADRMSMAHSLELRCPFLDYRLIEFAASLPADWKMKAAEKKFILKESQLGRLPEDIIYRKKRGFNAPVSHWFNDELGQMLKEQMPRLSSLIKPDSALKYLSEHKEQKADHSLKLLCLLNLGLWMESNLN